MQTKYDTNTLDFMSRDHAIFISSNTIFGIKPCGLFQNNKVKDTTFLK